MARRARGSDGEEPARPVDVPAGDADDDDLDGVVIPDEVVSENVHDEPDGLPVEEPADDPWMRPGEDPWGARPTSARHPLPGRR